MLFHDRHDAGRALAARLVAYETENPVVLALPRGGVPVGYEVAVALKAPLDVALVRRLGMPFHPELALGAVVGAHPPEIVINDEIRAAWHVSDEYLREESARQLNEIERQRLLYRPDRPPVSIVDATVIVVDDGIATGATAKAVLLALRRGRPRRVVLAVPVAPPLALDELAEVADHVMALAAPADFEAVGDYYDDFHQTSDDEVLALLKS